MALFQAFAQLRSPPRGQVLAALETAVNTEGPRLSMRDCAQILGAHSRLRLDPGVRLLEGLSLGVVMQAGKGMAPQEVVMLAHASASLNLRPAEPIAAALMDAVAQHAG